MKLRAKIIDQAAIVIFSKIFQSLSKLSKLCVIRLTRENIYIVLSDQNVTNPSYVTCQISQDKFFEDYIMEGLDRMDANEIYMEVLIENINMALKNPNATKSLKLKLTKRKGPTLTIETENTSTSTGSRVVVHDVPVNLISPKFWSEYQEPKMASYHVSIDLPNVRILKNVMDRMKNMGNQITISTLGRGDMALNIESDVVSITTDFTDLICRLPQESQEYDHEATARDRDGPVKVRVDLKKISNFLACHQAGAAERVILNLRHENSVHLFLVGHDEDFVFQFVMPGAAENA